MTGERIALEHPIERGFDLFLRNLPRYQRALGQVRREQRLPDAADRAGAQHRRDARHDKIDIHSRPARDFFERLADEAFDFVLRNGEDLRVNRVVVFDRDHKAT